MKKLALITGLVLTLAGCDQAGIKPTGQADQTGIKPTVQADQVGIKPTGQACLGNNYQTLIESKSMQGACQKGDIIATKNPAYFCDFKSSVAYNAYNSAFCIYTGKPAAERTATGSE